MNTRVYDLPTRLFHWAFVICFLTAFGIAELIDDDDAKFSYHMIVGLVLFVVIILRLVWALVGTQHARWQDLVLQPSALMQYLKHLFSQQKTTWAGHNPASSWAALIMILSALGLVMTGVAMVLGIAVEVAEEVHEFCVNLLLFVALLHVLGLVLHSFVHSDALPNSMITGNKRNLPPSQKSVSVHRGAALIFIVLILSTLVTLFTNYNEVTRQLSLFGWQVTLTEQETHDSDHNEHEKHEEHD